MVTSSHCSVVVVAGHFFIINLISSKKFTKTCKRNMQKVMSFLSFQSCQNLVRKFLVCAHIKTFPNRGKKVKEITADFCLEVLVCLLTFL